MCFHIHKDHRRVKTAKRDLTVWKRLHFTGSGTLLSPIIKFRYEKGKLYRTDQSLVVYPSTNPQYIDEGFHAYSSYAKCESNIYLEFGESVFVCTIPKGAKYYWNPLTEEIVADRLIIGSEVLTILGRMESSDTTFTSKELFRFKLNGLFSWLKPNLKSNTDAT